VYIPTHEGIGMFDDLSDAQLEALVARIYSNNVDDDACTDSGSSPGKDRREEINAAARARTKAKRAALEASPDFPARQEAIRAKRRATALARPKSTHCKSGKHLKTVESFHERHGCRLCQQEHNQSPEGKAKAAARRAAHPVVPKPKKPMVTKQCAVCSMEFATNQPKKLYCSEACSKQAYNLRHGLVLPTLTKTCERCGESFETTRSEQKYCCERCAENAKDQRRFERDPVKVRALNRASKKRLEQKNKAAVMENYGNQCAWPACNVATGLHLHHILLNGEQHRSEHGDRAGSQFYAWLKKAGYPDDLQLLCAHHHRLHHKQVRQIAKLNPGVPKALISVVLTKYRETLRKKPSGSVRIKLKKAASN
jgi:hypothetical protein